MKKLWATYKKHEEIINYLIVGVCTTIFSLIFYFASTRTFLDPNNPFELQIANIIKWVSGVLFAYVTNKIFVFKSKRKDILIIPCCYTVSGYVCNVAYGYKNGHLGCYRHTGFTGVGYCG